MEKDRSAIVRTGALLACAVALGGAFACAGPAPPQDDFSLTAPTQKQPSGSNDPPAQNETVAPPQSGSGNDAGVAADADAATSSCKTVAPNNACGLAPQCGCSASQTCEVTDLTTGAAVCIPAGATTLGRACKATADCESGLTCRYGVCRPYCANPSSACTIAGTGLCIAATDDHNKPIPNLDVCTVSCDPVSPDALCGQGNTCLWFPTLYAPNKVTDCNYPGTTGTLQPCTSDFDCTAGNACAVHPIYGQECEKWCRLPATQFSADCTNGFTCKDVFGANGPTINGIKEGTCQD